MTTPNKKSREFDGHIYEGDKVPLRKACYIHSPGCFHGYCICGVIGEPIEFDYVTTNITALNICRTPSPYISDLIDSPQENPFADIYPEDKINLGQARYSYCHKSYCKRGNCQCGRITDPQVQELVGIYAIKDKYNY